MLQQHWLKLQRCWQWCAVLFSSLLKLQWRGVAALCLVLQRRCSRFAGIVAMLPAKELALLVLQCFHWRFSGVHPFAGVAALWRRRSPLAGIGVQFLQRCAAHSLAL